MESLVVEPNLVLDFRRVLFLDCRVVDLQVTPFSAPASVFPGLTLTGPTGIRKRLISATIKLSNGTTVGGMYNRDNGSWVPIAVPGAQSTAAYGPESIPNGFRAVGSFKNPKQKGDSGFVYDSVSNKFRPDRGGSQPL